MSVMTEITVTRSTAFTIDGVAFTSIFRIADFGPESSDSEDLISSSPVAWIEDVVKIGTDYGLSSSMPIFVGETLL